MSELRDQLIKQMQALHPTEWHDAEWTVGRDRLQEIKTSLNLVIGEFRESCEVIDRHHMFGFPVNLIDGNEIRIASLRTERMLKWEREHRPDFSRMRLP